MPRRTEVEGPTAITVTFGGHPNRLEVTTAATDVYWAAPQPHADRSRRHSGATNAPPAIQQDGAKVLVDYGIAGEVEIRTSHVFVQRRFLGWANFLFDQGSSFWGRDFGQVLGLVLSDDRRQSLARAALARAARNHGHQCRLGQSRLDGGALLIVVFSFDNISNTIRQRLIGSGTP